MMSSGSETDATLIYLDGILNLAQSNHASGITINVFIIMVALAMEWQFSRAECVTMISYPSDHCDIRKNELGLIVDPNSKIFCSVSLALAFDDKYG